MDTKKTKVYSDLMPGHPVLNGVAGSLIALLDAVLVNGFGSTGVTSIVVLDGIATATFPGTHPFLADSVGSFSGATPSGLNGEQRILTRTSNTVTFATALANQTATGTISAKVAAAGWSKVFTGTNQAAYKSNSILGTGMYLRVDDSTTTAGRVLGYESMTDVNTGVAPFPSASQIASPGLFWSKSSVASATERPWVLIADDRGFYFMPQPSGTAAQNQCNYFGDFNSLKNNDPYACALYGQVANQSASIGTFVDDFVYQDTTATATGGYVARAANALGGSQRLYKCCLMTVGLTAGSAIGSNGQPYPSAVDNSLILSQVLLYGANFGYRGYLPGIRNSPQLVVPSFATFDTVIGSGDLDGTDVIAVKLGSNTVLSQSTMLFFEHKADWY